MTNEAILRDTKILSSRRFTCATSTAIPKGTLLQLSADNTASEAIDSSQFIGIAHADVNNSTDTSFNTDTNITADKGAIYELVASGSIGKGAYVVCAADNKVRAATEIEAASMNRLVVGVTLEAASDAETVNVEVLL